MSNSKKDIHPTPFRYTLHKDTVEKEAIVGTISLRRMLYILEESVSNGMYQISDNLKSGVVTLAVWDNELYELSTPLSHKYIGEFIDNCELSTVKPPIDD